MPGHSARLLSLVSLFSLLAQGAQGETPRSAEDRKTNRGTETGRDSYGDPLPKGCWVRIGTIRWRHGCRVWAVAFHPDGKSLLAASVDGSVRVWDSNSGKEIRRFTGHHRLLLSFAISRTGRDLAVVTDEKL